MDLKPEDPSVSYPPSVGKRPGPQFKFMGRRRVQREDRGGDPLTGLAVLFPIGIVFALGFLLATLWGVGLQDLLTSKQMTIVSNPGASDMKILVRRDGRLEQVVLSPGQQTTIAGTVVGSLYQLADGSFIYMPVTGAAPLAPVSSPTPLSGDSYTPSTPPSPLASPSPSLTPAGSVGPATQPDPSTTQTDGSGTSPNTEPRPQTGGPNKTGEPAKRGAPTNPAL